MYRKFLQILALASGVSAAEAARADDDPRFCPTRPSIGGSSCTTEPGRVHVEASFVDWERDDTADQREDRIVTADLLVRAGVGSKTEVQLGWTGYGQDRRRDKANGTIDRVTGVGDLRFAFRQHLAGEKGKPLSAGVEGFVTVPTGKSPLGDGTWSAGVIVPVQYDLTERLAIAVTGEADAAANQSGQGRHFAYSGVTSLRYKLSGHVSTTAELFLERDKDPADHETHALAAFSTAWRRTKVLQLDMLAVVRLNRHSPDIRLVAGGAILF